MDKNKSGLLLGILTFVLWGISPIYFKFLDGVGSAEILAHRIIWSAVILFFILKFQKKLKGVRRLLRIRKLVIYLFCTSFFMTANWGIFIYAINKNQILETSLGYFIGPIISILLGAIVLKEKLNLILKISVLIVFIAICIQIYALGKLPMVSLLLPLFLSLYGLFRKRVSVPTFEGLFIETLLISPIALIYIVFLASSSNISFGLNMTGFLLILSGLITVIPLLTFTAATKYLKLSTMGFLQYLSPTLSLFVAVFIYDENLDKYKIISFTLIWISLVLASFSRMKRVRR